MDANEDLSHWRKAFPITTRSVYLNNNSLGAMPSGARDRLREYAKLWDERGVRAWEEGWWAVHDEIAALLAPILGVAAEQISLHQNVTMASAVFVSAIEFPAERNRIVFTDMNFPSLRYLYGGVARQRGAELVIVPTDDGIGVPTERLLEAIDERTALVPISHVLFRSAFIQDAPKIIRRAREVGAIVLLDVFQSAGTVPLALESWGCHAAVGGALKFLCGGPGACFLYVEEELGRELAPALSGWMAHQRPFDFEFGPLDRREDGWRFLHGTPNVPALYAAREGIKILGQIGIEKVRRQSLRQTALLLRKARELGLRTSSPPDPERRAGTVTVDVPEGHAVCQELIARNFIVDYRPGAGIRIAPHFYNLDSECEAVVSELREILDRGAGRPRERGAGVPP